MANSRRARFEAEAVGHLDELFRVARRVIGDTAAAEDLVQETYLRAWQAFDGFEPGTNCRAWLFKILFRVIGGRRRELQKEMAMFDECVFDQARRTYHAAPSRLSALQIERAFAQLPIAFATVIQLVDIEGLTYKQAAAVLEVPVGTVMSRLHRGREEFRTLLAPAPALLPNTKERP